MAKRTKITNKQRIAYAIQESRFQVMVYRKKIDQGAMTQSKANMQIQIIRELAELAELLEEKGLDYYKLIESIKNLKPKGNVQQQLFKS